MRKDLKWKQKDLGMLHQGKLKGWNASQGRGFIQREKAGPDIQICSSGFRMKPASLQDGDSIFFQIELDDEGKAKAVAAYKAGQRLAPEPGLKQPMVSSFQFQHVLSFLFALSVLAWLAYQFWYLLNTQFEPELHIQQAEISASDRIRPDNPVWPPLQVQQGLHFQCEGKQHCSQMHSCDEAKFYLANCPDVVIDGELDGIPCEQQLCEKKRFKP
jgi:cold shock CspA family protein